MNVFANKKINFQNIIFISYFLCLISDVFDAISRVQPLLNILDIFSILFIGVYILKSFLESKKQYIKDNFLLLIFLFLTIVTALVSKNRTLIKLGFLLLCFKSVDFDSFIKKDIYIRTFLVMAMMIMYLFGLTDNGILEYRNGFMRNSFGMGHPNSFAFYLSIIFMEFTYLDYKKSEKSTLKSILVAIAFLVFNYFFLGSRTNIILIVLAEAFILITNKFDFVKFIDKILPFLFVFFLVISYLLCNFYTENNNFLMILNKLLSNRLYLTNVILDNYDITLLGNNIIKDSFYILDNAYMNILIRYGLLVSVCFSILFYKSFLKLIKENKILLIILAILLIFGLSESPIYVPAKNPFILLLAYNSKTKSIKYEE